MKHITIYTDGGIILRNKTYSLFFRGRICAIYLH